MGQHGKITGKMKLLLTILLFPLFTSAQWYKPTKNDVAIAGLSFVAGSANGLEETIKFHYGTFKHIHPGANDQYWNPAISWTNKNRNWITQALPTFTDGYHISRGISRVSMIAAVSISINDKQNWKVYLRKFIISMAANRAGQYLIYDIIYKQ
jgi:hypothetical protein